MSEQTFQQGDGCCECNCTGGDSNMGECCFVLWCPCFASCNAAEKVDESGATHFCLTCCGCFCCSVMMLGQKVEEKRGLKKHDTTWHCLHSCFDGCSCHHCRVVNECNVYEKEGAVGAAPAAAEMERK